MVVEEIGKSLFLDQKLRVGSARLSLGLRERKRDPDQLGEARIFHRGINPSHLTQTASSRLRELSEALENPARSL